MPGLLIATVVIVLCRPGTVGLDTVAIVAVSLSVLCAGLAALFVGWLARKWLDPVSRLARKMEEVQAGDLSVEVPVEREDEIGELGRHFNEMVQAIRRTRERSREANQRQANIEKFAALGRLSAGVAHEINNPVGGILTALEVIGHLNPESRRYKDYMVLMKSGLERIGEIVHQLLRFARQPSGQRDLVDLNAMVQDVSHLARLQYRSSRMHIVTRFGEIPLVDGDTDLLNQLFLNLSMNAFQAMADGGILTTTTSTDEEDNAVVCLEDTGPGLPVEELESIFEPFYTTKEVGEGTGLGLSVALGIVQAHGGTIEASNRPEGGARLTIRLPAAPGPDGED
ncbi:MAG: HAMP domain-containing sensor histidine kinase [Planctomycetota bacterium]